MKANRLANAAGQLARAILGPTLPIDFGRIVRPFWRRSTLHQMFRQTQRFSCGLTSKANHGMAHSLQLVYSLEVGEIKKCD